MCSTIQTSNIVCPFPSEHLELLCLIRVDLAIILIMPGIVFEIRMLYKDVHGGWDFRIATWLPVVD